MANLATNVDRATLAFEIGTEEIPAFDLQRATKQLAELVPQSLDAVKIPHGDVAVYSSPRRLVAVVADVAYQTEALEEEFRGPAAKIAFDESGAPTKAAIGFARGKGLTVDDLERREVNGAEYVFATRKVPARESIELLPEVLLGIINGLRWPKSCKWGTTKELFSRPVRWIVALLGETVIPMKFADVISGNCTYGHRFLAPGAHEVPNADDLISVIRSIYVVPSEGEREAIIREGVAEAEAETGLRAELPAKTLTEVVNLTEYPTVLVGTFDPDFLRVPEEIIVDAMLMHQRYFPLYDSDGHLSNRFIVVSNGDPACSDNIIDGNERVVAARLYDARFFYEEDLKQPLEAYIDSLDDVVFQENLGTMRAKTDRVVRLTEKLVGETQLAQDVATDAIRAARLAKADLVTNAVIEFTTVQGIMGSYYAAASGENDRVARAIADHYKPRFSGDEIPADDVGRLVALADKLDTICGLFAVGQAPTGSSDPFALRRAALGIVTILSEGGLPVKLVPAIDASLAIYAADGLEFDAAAVRAEVIDFFLTRTQVMLRDMGIAADTVYAVFEANVQEPVDFIKRSRALENARQQEGSTFEDLATAYARANNLRDADAGVDFDPALFTPVEASLAEAVEAAEAAVDEALAKDDYPEALAQLASLRGPIDAFFEEVMVMDEDLALRANHMKLLNRFVNVFANVANFGKMAK